MKKKRTVKSGSKKPFVRQQPAYARVRQLAETHAVSIGLVYKLIHSGELPARRVGRSLLIPIADAKRVLGG